MPLAYKVAVPVVVAPELDELVRSAAHDDVALEVDREAVHGRRVAAVEVADGRAVVRVPVGELAVRAAGDELGAVGVVDGAVEEGVCEARGVALGAGGVGDVPDDAGAIGGGGDDLGAAVLQRDGVDGVAVVLHGRHHGLRVVPEVPHAHHALLPAAEHEAAVLVARDGGHGLVVGVVDDKHEVARLGREGADLAVRPAAEDGLPVGLEADALAVEVGHHDAEQLPAGLDVPDADLAAAGGGKDRREHVREGDVGDVAVVGGLEELGLDGAGARVVEDVVDVGAEGADVEPDGGAVDAVEVHGKGGDAALDLGLADLGEGLPGGGREHHEVAVVASDDDVSRGEHGHAVDPLGDHVLGDGAPLLEQQPAEVDLQDVPGLGAAVHVLVALVAGEGGEGAAEAPGLDVRLVQLVVLQVHVPDAQVADAPGRDAPGVVAEEGHAAGEGGVGGGAADGLQVDDVP